MAFAPAMSLSKPWCVLAQSCTKLQAQAWSAHGLSWACILSDPMITTDVNLTELLIADTFQSWVFCITCLVHLICQCPSRRASAAGQQGQQYTLAQRCYFTELLMFGRPHKWVFCRTCLVRLIRRCPSRSSVAPFVSLGMIMCTCANVPTSQSC